MQIARRHLRVLRAGVEQRRRRRHVIERSNQSVKLNRLMRRSGQAAGHAQKEVLRRLDNPSRDRIAQQITIVNSAQAQSTQSGPRSVVVDRMVQLARMGLHKLGSRRLDDALLVSVSNRLRKRMEVLAGDLLDDGSPATAARRAANTAAPPRSATPPCRSRSYRARVSSRRRKDHRWSSTRRESHRHA